MEIQKIRPTTKDDEDIENNNKEINLDKEREVFKRLNQHIQHSDPWNPMMTEPSPSTFPPLPPPRPSSLQQPASSLSPSQQEPLPPTPPRKETYQPKKGAVKCADCDEEFEIECLECPECSPSGKCVCDPNPCKRKYKEKVNWKIFILRVCIAFVLCSLASGLGAAAFLLLRSIELNTLQTQFNSATNQIQTTVTTALRAKFVANSLVQNIFRYGIPTGAMGRLPNVTLNGFEQIVNDICTLSNSRGISWNPLITPTTRNPWNAYAQANLGLVTATNLTFARSVISNWRVGPYNKTSGKAVPVGNDISGSPAPFRSLLFPVWQMAPINQNYKAIFLEPHSFVGTRQKIIDLGLASRKGGFTDILQLVQDSTPRPSSTLYAPMYGLDNNLIGLFAGVFSWDTLFQSALPNYMPRIDCVLQSATVTFTIAIDSGTVSIVGKADLHDNAYTSYAQSFTPDTSSFSTTAVTTFTITMYPSSAFYNKYITQVPFQACIIVVSILVFTMIIVVIYDLLIRQRETKLITQATEAEDTTKLVTTMLPAHLAKNTAADLKAKSVAMKAQLLSHPVHNAIYDDSPSYIILSLLQEHPENARELVEGKTAFDFAVERDNVADSLAADSKTTIDTTRTVGQQVITALLINAFPIDEMTKKPLSPTWHGFAWVNAVQLDRYESSVIDVMSKYPSLSVELSNAEDIEGRSAVNIASPKCKRVILQFVHFFRRYEIKSINRALHISATCTLHLAIDHEDQMRPVALKFMQQRDQYQREIRVRSQGQLSDEFVVNLLRSHDPDEDPDFEMEVKRKGLEDFPYMIVMDAGERNLSDVLAKENIAGRDWDLIRSFSIQIAKCIAHLHDKGIIHGDIKPLNIVRRGGGFKLIDLDASCNFRSLEETACNKFSSGYVPPECLYVRGDVVCVRSPLCRHMVSTSEFSGYFEAPEVEEALSRRGSAEILNRTSVEDSSVPPQEHSTISSPMVSRRGSSEPVPGEVTSGQVSDVIPPRGGGVSPMVLNGDNLRSNVDDNVDDDDDEETKSVDLDFELILAHPAQDMWAFGVVLYHMAAKCSLFNCDYAGNVVSENDLRDLAFWTEDIKWERMSMIPDRYARNLISQLLMKDPLKRPNIKQALSHPFMTGRKATRLDGEKAEFDVFLSYRCNADLEIAEALYNALIARGVTVWWDKKCLLPGEDWEENFCRGLVKSRVFLPLYSRNAINHPTYNRQSFALLTPDSNCDNMFLEQRLALELRDRGLIEKVFPVMIGHINEEHPEEGYVRYRVTGSEQDHPVLPHYAVKCVEEKLIMHLEKQGLGLPYHDNVSIYDTITAIMKYQGAFVIGELGKCLNQDVAPAVVRMLPAVTNRDLVAGYRMNRGGTGRVHQGMGISRSRNESISSFNSFAVSRHGSVTPAQGSGSHNSTRNPSNAPSLAPSNAASRTSSFELSPMNRGRNNMNRNIQSALLHVQHSHMPPAAAAAALAGGATSSHESVIIPMVETHQSAILHALDEGDDDLEENVEGRREQKK